MKNYDTSYYRLKHDSVCDTWRLLRFPKDSSPKNPRTPVCKNMYHHGVNKEKGTLPVYNWWYDYLVP